jgi:hypothetical protein
MTPEGKEQFIRDCLRNMKAVKSTQSFQSDPFNRLLASLETDRITIWNQLLPILKAGGATDSVKLAALRELVLKSWLEKLRLYSKDELETVLAILFSQATTNDVESRLWGGQKDLLSE